MFCALREGKPECHELSRAWWQQIFNCASLMFSLPFSGVVTDSIQNKWFFRCGHMVWSVVVLQNSASSFKKLGMWSDWTFELTQRVSTSHLGGSLDSDYVLCIDCKLVMENILSFFCMYLDFFNLNFMSALIFFSLLIGYVSFSLPVPHRLTKIVSCVNAVSKVLICLLDH